jgi:uncharacterized protein (DUF58 family)
MPWKFLASSRRLEVSTGGKWFLLFTVLLGVVAINSGNNVIYLMESLLLSSLIFSGLLSEYALSRVDFDRGLAQAVAGCPASDRLRLRSRAWLPLYCLEVGEWEGGSFRPVGFCLALGRKGEARFFSKQVLPRRGRHRWEGLAVATSFPFGFARKIRILGEPGSRIVWPSGARADAEKGGGRKGEWDWVAGEIEEVETGQDVSRVHWPSSLRAGRLLTRPRKPTIANEEVRLSLDPDLGLEERISAASGRLRAGAEALLLQRGRALQRVEGAGRALDLLALLPRREP